MMMKNSILMTVGAVSAALVMVSCQGTKGGDDVSDAAYPFDENGNYVDGAANDAAGWAGDSGTTPGYEPTPDVASNNSGGGGYTPPADPPSYSKPSQSSNYTVARGDSLWKISRKFGVSVGELQRANGLSGSDIQIGQRLTIPGGGAGSGAVVSSTGGSSVHTVRSGETLWGISRKYGVSVSALKSANGLSGDNLRIGQSLQIP